MTANEIRERAVELYDALKSGWWTDRDETVDVLADAITAAVDAAVEEERSSVICMLDDEFGEWQPSGSVEAKMVCNVIKRLIDAIRARGGGK